MKKISVLVLALSTSVIVFAQNNPQLRTPMAKQVFFGVKAGANLANLRQENLSARTTIDGKTSMHGGLFVNIPMGNMWHFQPELLYNAQGAKLATYSGLTGTTATVTEQDLNYISLPLMFQLKAANGIYLELGPQASYLIKAKQDAQSGATTGEVDNKASFDKFDIAANGGIGWTSRVGFGLSARYSHGLSNILEDGGGNNSANDGPEYKNSTFQIGLHYMFGASK
ncbi:MAG: porin family protein [Bacteroidota bacterium]